MPNPYSLPGFVIDPQPFDSEAHRSPDPRGVFKIYEPPLSTARYVMGVDPSVGITGWDREVRVDDDKSTDNGAVEVIRVGERGGPDIQVAEFAAPVDAIELGTYANFLGRLFCGRSESGQALCIIEVYPGPGLETLRTMINVYGYTNHYQHTYLDTLAPRTTSVGSLGWTASKQSVLALWIQAKRHMALGKVVLHSSYLIEEMRDCEMDPVKMVGKALGGRHDDRVRAMQLCLWAAHLWTTDVQTDDTKATQGEGQVDWQRSAVTVDQMMDQANDMISDVMEEAPDWEIA